MFKFQRCSNVVPILVTNLKAKNCVFRKLQLYITTYKYPRPNLLASTSTLNLVNSKTGTNFYSYSTNKECDKRNNFTLLEKLIKSSPERVKPYLQLARIDKPTGTLLLLWPCFWGIALSTDMGSLPSFYYLSLFGLGAFLMRGAGCTINDMWDQNLDSKVERTKSRPLASGVITKSDALAFLAFQLSMSSIILLQLNWYSIILGCSSMALVVSYPLAKRFTNWPQLFLGFTFNWGVLLGYAAVKGFCEWHLVLPLYLAGVSWTMVYDTIYALQDKKDDSKVGIKSTALIFGKNTKIWLAAFSSSMIGNLLILGIVDHQTWPYFSSVALVATHLASQILTLKMDKPEDCAKKFKSNQSLGLLLFLGIVTGTVFKAKETNDPGNIK